MGSILRKSINSVLSCLPSTWQTKMRILLHVLAERWIIPPTYLHSQNFSGKIPPNWQNILTETDKTSIEEVAEFFRRIQTDLLVWNNDSKLQVLVKEEFANENIPVLPQSPELKKNRKKYGVSGDYESLVALHGVIFLPEKIQESLKNKTIVDAGSCIGSFIIPYADKFSPEMIYAFEPNPQNAVMLEENLLRNNIQKTQFEIFRCAVGATNKEISFDGTGMRIDVPGDHKVELRTLDSVLLEKETPVGLIKVDVEGMGLDLLIGAHELIKRDRPVLALSCYHTPEELFGQYEYLVKEFPFYQISFTSLPPKSGWELTLLAVPAEQL